MTEGENLYSIWSTSVRGGIVPLGIKQKVGIISLLHPLSIGTETSAEGTAEAVPRHWLFCLLASEPMPPNSGTTALLDQTPNQSHHGEMLS